jgi:hypothetical protein
MTRKKELGQEDMPVAFGVSEGRGSSYSKHHMAFIRAKNGVSTTSTPNMIFS